MIIQPKIRGFICTTAHPLGCQKMVENQIAYVRSFPPIVGAKNVLIIGASTGYGLASRIVATFGLQAKTIGVFFEKEADEKRTASPGWYNSAAFEALAAKQGYAAFSINGDAFSEEIKQKTAELITQQLGQVDLIIYSLAAPKRLNPTTHALDSSVLKPIGHSFTGKTIDAFKREVKTITIEPANEKEIQATISVMGGDDWLRWIEYLKQRQLLSPGIKTIAYSYLGPEITHPIYKKGTIGSAKADLKATLPKLNKLLAPLQGEALIAIAKAVVTQASSAIPVVPLYIALLFKIMKTEGTHEGCIEQMTRLFRDYLYSGNTIKDKDGYIRLDDKEMSAEVQNKIHLLWPNITNENLSSLTDVEGYCEEFYHLFGFHVPGINYDEEVNQFKEIPSLK